MTIRNVSRPPLDPDLVLAAGIVIWGFLACASAVLAIGAA